MKQVLFVEDDAILARVYCKALRAEQFEVTHCPDGESGLAALQVLRPDVILLDLMLPRVSGQDLLRIIRNSEDIRQTPVVVFTSAFREELREELERLGANRVLSKAEFVPRQVISVLQELLPGGAIGKAGKSAGAAFGAASSAGIPELIAKCGRLIQDINREISFNRRGGGLRTLRGSVKEVADAALAAGRGPQAYFCEALDAFLFEVSERPTQLGSSGLRTITQAVDFIAEAFDPGSRFDLAGYPVFDILTVDDDSISRCGIQLALGKIKQHSVECSQAGEALALCEQRPFDLIFLDVELPGMNGFEVCAQLRRAGKNQSAPVIFVTRHTDLQNRAQATMSGGTDVIGKPFNFMELAIKALMHLLRSKLQ